MDDELKRIRLDPALAADTVALPSRTMFREGDFGDMICFLN